MTYSITITLHNEYITNAGYRIHFKLYINHEVHIIHNKLYIINEIIDMNLSLTTNHFSNNNLTYS